MSSYETTQAGIAYRALLGAVEAGEDLGEGFTESYKEFAYVLASRGYKVVTLDGADLDSDTWKDEDNFMR